MLEKIDVTLTVTPAAKTQLLRFLSEIKDYPALPGLLWSTDAASRQERWTVGFYDRRTVEGADFRGVLITAGDVEFVSPQAHLAAGLQGMQLDWQGDRFVVVSPLKH